MSTHSWIQLLFAIIILAYVQLPAEFNVLMEKFVPTLPAGHEIGEV